MSLEKPAYPAPNVEPKPWTLDALKDHCQTAVLLELHTIPLYMFSMYCVKPEDTNRAAEEILEVVKQEMLHLALAGNLLCAIGGQPVLYHPDHTPKYPCQMFFEPIDLYLWPPNKNAMRLFARIEEPFQPIILPQKPRILAGYTNIGKFYQSLTNGLVKLDEENSGKLFDPTTADRQFWWQDGVYGDDNGDDDDDEEKYKKYELHRITNLARAAKAMQLIIEQGEGSTGVDADVQPNHYHTFRDLETKDIPHYPTVEDPQDLESYAKGNILDAMLASDAAYCYLLLTIEKSWTKNNHRKDLMKNISQTMRFVLKPLCEFLVMQQLDGREEHAAPPFNYYKFTSTDLAHQELVKAIEKAEGSYPKSQNAKLTFALTRARRLFDLSKLNA